MTYQAVESLKHIDPPRILGLNLAIFFAVVGGGQLGLWLQGPTTAAPLIWIPTGVGVASLLLFNMKAMPGIVAGSIAMVLLQQESFNNINLILGIPLQSISHPLQAFIAYQALSKFEDIDTLFSTRSGIKSFFYLGVIFSPIISASVGVLALSVNGVISLGIYNAAWLNWWFADVLGVLVVTPLIISATMIYLNKSPRGLNVDLLLPLSSAMAFGFILFVFPIGMDRNFSTILLLAVFPIVIWVGLQHQVFGASAISLAIAVISILGTAKKLGPFHASGVWENVHLNFYLLCLTLTGLVVAVAIRERQKAEGDLHASETRFREFARSVSDRHWESDADHIFTFISSPTGHLSEPSEKIIGKSMWDRFHRRAEPAALDDLKSIFEKCKTFQGVPLTWRGLDGHMRYVQLNAIALFDEAEKFIGYRGTTIDETSKILANLNATEQEKRFQQSFEDSQIGMAIVEINGKIRLVNPAFSDLLGYSAAELQSKSMGEITYSGDAEKAIEDPAQNDSAKSINSSNEQRYVHKNGKLIWTLTSRSVISNDDDAPNYTIAQIQDITIRKEAEDLFRTASELVEHTSRSKSNFLANITYELLTPLNAILGYGQLLKDNPKEALSPVQEKHLGRLFDAGGQLKNLINDILELTKFEAGTMTITSERVAPMEVIDDAAAIIRKLAAASAIELTYNASAIKLPEIWVDRVRLKQVLLHILSNAIKFNREKGQIVLDARPLGKDLLRISISDTGRGIPQERRDEIFLPFAQLQGNEAKRRGTGIGLAITKHMVEVMGGKIDFDSSEKGSTFWVDFPLVEMSKAGEIKTV